MGDQINDHLRRLSERANIALGELRTIDSSDELERYTDYSTGEFDNGDWLSAELKEMGEQFDRMEDVRDTIAE